MKQRKTGIITAIILSLFMSYACIDEDMENCPVESVLYIKIVETTTREDITSSGEVDAIDLFVFDQEGNYLESISLTQEQIRQQEAIRIKHAKNQQALQIAAWGNLSEKEVVSEISSTDKLDNLTISLITQTDGYTLPPDNLFYGIKSLNTRNSVDLDSEMTIFRKNARVYISVRGLPAESEDEDYFFKIRHSYNGYTFKGEPTYKVISLKESGYFMKNSDYVTRTPVNLIHSGNSSLNNDGVAIYLLDKKENIWAEAKQDMEGGPILLKPGTTTNVLIDLDAQEGMNVHIKITDWNEVHQWVNWR
ncbi:FimB/Mfa2 family fimbrial subunit [Porphyromonadaceae bacterium OttesenSCG-928-L07]|nr:FimB/Mfa2 family fimbrial subunit [Porphyromonadaceae bacterium OttesenSCG-928-L07]MDL2251638.1 FimB/Mfa2 family fimbrial subunit [Odoribacter sp. OttesenSCG-928-J03]